MNEPLLPWRVCSTKSGITTAKLKVSVPTIVIIVSGIHRSGTSWMYRTAARSWPLALATTGGWRSSDRRIIARLAITAR